MMTNHEISHRLALRELVDTFSNLADEKMLQRKYPCLPPMRILML